MPGRGRSIAAVLLAISFAAFCLSNRAFDFLEDETTIVNAARKPVATTIRIFITGRGEHEHPPLSDILLHYWLPAAGNSAALLRAPSVVLFLGGLVLLGLACRKLDREQSFPWVIAIGVLSPFTFHFARLAGWYSFSFFLVAALTLAWLRYCECRSPGRLAWFVFLAVLLIYTNYFGWVLVGCLLLDGWIVDRKSALRATVITLGTMAVAYAPLWRSFLRETARVRGSGSLAAKAMLAVYNVYILFVSESAAPWFWYLSIPAAMSIAVALWMTWKTAPGRSRLFLLYFSIAFGGLTAAGKIDSRRLLFISGWLMMALAIGMTRRRRTLTGALALIAVIGWTGIFSRKWYSAPHFIEPWAEVAREAAEAVRSGGLVVWNSPAFAFYLNYALDGKRAGFVDDPHVYNPPRWKMEEPAGPASVLAVIGVNESQMHLTSEVMEDLMARCQRLGTERLAPDSGSSLKEKFFPQFRQPPFRITVERFRCPGNQ